MVLRVVAQKVDGFTLSDINMWKLLRLNHENVEGITLSISIVEAFTTPNPIFYRLPLASSSVEALTPG